MKTPLDLNSVLFAQLERLSATDLKGEELQAELQKADAIEKLVNRLLKITTCV